MRGVEQSWLYTTLAGLSMTDLNPREVPRCAHTASLAERESERMGPVTSVQCFTVEVTANAVATSQGPLLDYLSGSLCIVDAGGNKTEMSGNLFDMITALSHELKNRLEASARSQGLCEDSTTHVGYGPMHARLPGTQPAV
jgi:hypothetical protein